MIRQLLFATTLAEVTTPSVDARLAPHRVFLSHRAQVTSAMHVFLDAA